MIEDDWVIKLENVNKTFSVWDKNKDTIRDRVMHFFTTSNGKREIKALKGVNLEIHKGELFGIVGRNGSGKSTLLKILTGAYPPDKGGVVKIKGRLLRMALGMGFDVNLTARENIYVNGSILGLTFKQIGKKFDHIIAFAELENFIDTQVKFYSTGMRSRLAFAIAVHAEADIFLMDEFFGGVGDVRFKEKSKKVFEQNLLDKKRTIVLVSHNLPIIQKYCTRMLLLNRGEVVGIGSPDELLPIYYKLVRKERGVGAK